MLLGEVIKRLEKEPLGKKVARGFGTPGSYRGYYDELAFEPKMNTDVHYMLLQAKQARGTTYRGYKGGEYKMDEGTPVHIACYGMSGENDELTEERLEDMLSS